MTTAVQAEWADRLLAIGEAVRDRLLAVRAAGHDLASPVAQEGGDTIFAIDRHVEPVIIETIEAWPAGLFPLELIAEGMGEDGRRRFGPAEEPIRWQLLIDPIDGTRNIMYDLRSAWFLALAVPGDLPARTAHAIASVLVELPTSKQSQADIFAATAAGPAVGRRVDLGTKERRSIAVQPSRASTLAQGFAQVSSFFPGTKLLAAELMETIVAETLGAVEPGTAAVFDDQYISTGGQFVELATGRYRFCCDLRPLFYRLIERDRGRAVRGLECHPYDIAGGLFAKRAGVILTDGFGRPLDAPLSVHAPVHWCGYANEAIRSQVEPVIQRFFSDRGLLPRSPTEE